MSTLQETSEQAVALAKKLGASDAAASTTRERSVDTSWRDGKLEKVSDATSNSLSLALWVDGKYGSMVTSDLRPAALEKFAGDAVALVRALAKDPNRKITDPSLYGKVADLGLYDPAIAALTVDQRLARAKAMEQAARGTKGADKIVSVTASCSDSVMETARVHSNGFSGSWRSTNVGSEVEVSMKDADGKRPEDWASSDVMRLADLAAPESLGKEAADRTLAKLGEKKLASGTMKMVVEARAARSLFRHLMGPLSGSALQQKESFFEGQEGKAVASKVLTVTDDPLLARGLASRPYDGEGIASKTRTIVEGGVLKTFYVDVYYANKLGRAPTTGNASNVIVTPGTQNLDALLKDMKDGILVTGFLGGNSNSTTGVFSLGFRGYRIANGERKEPISEMNLSGKHLDFWKKLVAVGNDPYVYASMRSPSLVFDGASIAGT